MVKLFKDSAVAPEVERGDDYNVVQEVGRSPLTVPTGAETQEVLEKVKELAKARKRFHQLVTKAVPKE